MLGFRWLATQAGAPDDSRYQEAVDHLADVNRVVLQNFPKPNDQFQEPRAALQQYVDDWLRRRTSNRVVVMVHGFDFDVSKFSADTGQATGAADDPYNRVFAQPGHELAPVRPESWLPIVGETDEAGTQLADCAIAFGWDSDYSFFGPHGCLENGYQYAALDVAPTAARALASVLASLRGKDLQVDLLAHSLGTRVTCQALRRLAGAGIANLLHRVVLLEGSEYSVDAYDAVRRHPATEFISIGNQEDDWPPRGAWISHPYRFNGTPPQWVIGYQGIGPFDNLADLQIDRKNVQDWALQHGYTLLSGPAVQGDQTRGEHWAGYIHAGNRALLTDLFRKPELSPAWFRANGAPLGFQYNGYGQLAGVDVPLMPATCEERTRLYRIA